LLLPAVLVLQAELLLLLPPLPPLLLVLLIPTFSGLGSYSMSPFSSSHKPPALKAPASAAADSTPNQACMRIQHYQSGRCLSQITETSIIAIFMLQLPQLHHQLNTTTSSMQWLQTAVVSACVASASHTWPL
jgi:hypothetical protein